MAATFRAISVASSVDDGSFSITIARPTGLQNGDVMIAVIFGDQGNVGWSSSGVPPPTGWTVVGPDHVSNNFEWVATVLTKIASSEPSSWTFISSGGFADSCGIVGAWSLADATTPIDVSDYAVTGGVTTQVATSATVTTAKADETVVYFSCAVVDPLISPGGSSWPGTSSGPGTYRGIVNVQSVTNRSAYLEIVLTDQLQATAGAVNGTFTYNIASQVTLFILALKSANVVKGLFFGFSP